MEGYWPLATISVSDHYLHNLPQAASIPMVPGTNDNPCRLAALRTEPASRSALFAVAVLSLWAVLHALACAFPRFQRAIFWNYGMVAFEIRFHQRAFQIVLSLLAATSLGLLLPGLQEVNNGPAYQVIVYAALASLAASVVWLLGQLLVCPSTRTPRYSAAAFPALAAVAACAFLPWLAMRPEKESCSEASLFIDPWI